MNKEEVFTSAKIATLVKDLQLKANKFDTNMENFNNSTEITIDDTMIDMFKSDLAI